MDEQLKLQIKEMISQEIREQLKSNLFTARKTTDLPTDALQVANRKFITLNGTTANRPVGSVLGQRYFDTTITKPVFWSGSTWVDSSGNPA